MQLAIIILGTITALFWIIMYMKYRNQFVEIIESIDTEEYFMSDLFFIGFGLMDFIKYRLDSKFERKKMRAISEIYGTKYAQYHLYVLRGGQMTYGLTFFTVAILLAALSNEMVLLLLGILLSALLVYYLEELLNDKITERREELIMDFPNVLSKLTLLVNSGMMMRDAWTKIAYSNNRQLYREMQLTVQEMDNGVSEIDAYMRFAERCYVKEIRKFAATMIQNMQKGSSDLVIFLKDMSDQMWETKKYMAKKKGDAAASKLMFPTVMIFVGVLILILVPMLSGMSL